MTRIGTETVAESARPSDTVVSDPAAAPTRRRVWFVDVVRLIASFQMVNGHTLDAVMVDSLRQGAIFARYDALRGLVSVTFLCVAGMAYHLSTLARFDAHRSSTRAVRRRFRRAAMIVAFGFVLHPTSEVYILKCIGLALLVLELLTLVARRSRDVVIAAGGLTALLILVAPWTDAVVPEGPGRIAIQWITHQGGSLFPFIPWAAYVFAGVVIAGWVLPEGGATDPEKILRRLVLGTAVLWLAAEVAALQPLSLCTQETTESARPVIALQKLAAVLALVTVLAALCRRLQGLPKLLRVLAAETLTLYVCHLLILFGPLPIGHWIGHRRGLVPGLLVVVPVMAASCLYAWWWHHFKLRRASRRAT